MGVHERANEIIDSQQREIAEMFRFVHDMDENGEITTEADARQRPVPEFSAGG